jgi:WD40 repeat protein
VRQLKGHTRGARYVTFGELEGHTVIIASGADGVIRVWDAVNGNEVAKLYGHTDGVWGLASGSHRGRAIVASSSDDLTIRIWDLKSQRSLIIPQASPAYAVALSDGWLAVGSYRHVYSLKFENPIFEEMTELRQADG